MKRLIYLFASTLLFVACSTGSSPLEKAISDYKQTDPKTGKLYDLHFKMIEMGETKKITVADSIKIMEENFRAENGKRIENYKEQLSTAQKNLEREKSGRFSSATMIDVHEKNIKEYEAKIAEAESAKPDLGKYSSKTQGEVLAQVITCTYSMDDLSGRNFTEKSEFILSPDGTKVYEARRIRE